ncbi:prolipoprotein diacylglyceryl transferase [Pseudobacteriovorax antillogorgiicola]|uniref:Phosphatidylglycerol--prolipoprotein diacylglyceryl transferase n=1 Tax=Pseudobacteriovorax antillogorgiicola TaxID=1513793 RepID=A0A1Y6B759_9BACT|nr:prolipoprotein diacylglyceryl transferase [Pseudobacteriovorax antillogorgiicola]TCS58650.1 prolipoprotein diacylglyceryl transferase [Pseudobacteriovorax antillogorgiicola]SME96389.1 prolipoprotein diacylglyceryl transferase [Pseudobacteriovorax antillogorgiicola]
MEYFVWDVSPEIFKIEIMSFSFAPRYYGLLFATGFLVGYQIMKKIFLHEGHKEEDLSSLLFHMMLGTIIGARLGHCLFYEPEYYLSNPLEILKIWKGGLASHGGSIGVLLACYLYKRHHPDQGYLWLADRLSIGTAFTACCIRLGNFFNSEILGKPTDVPWAIIFARTPNPEPRHPSMLYESAAYLVLFFLLLWLYNRKKENTRPGLLLGTLLTWVFTARVFIELTKENQVAFENDMMLNMGQLLSFPFIILGILLMTGKYKTIIKVPEGLERPSSPPPQSNKKSKTKK